MARPGTMAATTINRAFPQDATEESDRILLIARWVAEGRYGYAADPNGPLDARYMDVAMRWRSGVHPTSFMQLYRSAGLAIALDVYLSTAESITRTHISSLRDYRGMFLQQQPQRLCVGCFFAYWDDLLPCQHGFCKVCTHNYSANWKHNACLQMTHCPACLETFPDALFRP